MCFIIINILLQTTIATRKNLQKVDLHHEKVDTVEWSLAQLK